MAEQAWEPKINRIMKYLGFCLLSLVIVSGASANDGSLEPKSEVNVGFLESFPPYYLLDKNGNPSGFAADVMNTVAKRAGLTVKYRVKENWGEMNKALQTGDIDIIPNYGITELRKDFAAYTVPVDTFRISIFVRDDTNDIKSIEDLSERPVAVLAANAAHQILKSRGDFNLRVFDDIPKALFALLSAEVDAFVFPESVTWKLARETRIDHQIKVIGNPLKEIKRGMAVHKENAALLSILDEEIRVFVTSPEYRNIYTVWFGKPASFWTLDKVVGIFTALLAAIIICLLGWRSWTVLRLNRKLQKSEEGFRDLYENAPDMYCSVDVKTGLVTNCNQTLMTNLGMTKDDVLDHPVLALYHPDSLETVNNAFLELISTGQVQSNNLKIRGKNGITIDVELSVNAIRDENGIIISSRSIWRDITDRKLAEEAVRASEDRLTEIFAIAPEAVITIGSDMKIQMFNTSAERIFGYQAVEVLGQPMTILMPQRFRNGHSRHVREFGTSSDAYRFMDERDDIIALRKDGTEFPAAASVSKLEVEGDMIYTVMLHDVTERRKSETERRKALIEAEKANKAKSSFLATMSHELRTPLNAIIGFSDMLRGQYFGDLGSPKYKEYADDIQSSGMHLLNLVNDILDLSEIEAGERSLNKEMLSIKDMVDEITPMIMELSQRKGIKYTVEVLDGLPPIHAEKRAVKQVLLNLLNNAIKFTQEGGKITLSITDGDRHQTIKIIDTGVGIPDDEIETLTKPFARGETDSHKAQEGTGLGLSIVKSLVDLHQGELSIESKVGKGTTVTVKLSSEVT